MIYGSGDIAQVLQVKRGITFFASGVSNSESTDSQAFEREIKLLNSVDRSTHLVYFSTLSIYYSKSEYVAHKIEMERLIQKRFKSWTIIRLGNITWGTNPHTLLNYLKANPQAQRRDEIRYLIDKDEFLHWIDKIRIGTNDIMNITGKQINVKEL